MADYFIAGTALALATVLPLARKWELGIFPALLHTLAISLLAAVVLSGIDSLAHFTFITGAAAMWATVLLACLALLLAIFHRDPERAVPSRADVIISPADGRVVYVRRVQPGQVPVATKRGRGSSLPELSRTALGTGGAVAIGISMNFSDVHVNRSPIAGRVLLVKRVPGTFGSLRNPQMALQNERVTTIIDSGRLQVGIVQIASRLVRRITTFISEGDDVGLGHRIGAIRFGSQVDLLIPAQAHIRLAVQAGDRVTAGRTIIAVLAGERAPDPAQALTGTAAGASRADLRRGAGCPSTPAGVSRAGGALDRT